MKDGKDEDLTQEPEMIRAFRDTWELGIHSYLSYLRDRLWLAKDLLHESGSCFVQISDENVHYVRQILNDVFGQQNFVVSIVLKKKGGQKSGTLDPINDYILWTTKSKDAARGRLHKLYVPVRDEELAEVFRYAELPDGRELTLAELSKETGTDYRRFPRRVDADFPGAKLFSSENLTSGGFRRTQSVLYNYKGIKYDPGIAKGNCWKHSAITDDGSPSGLERLEKAGRLFTAEKQLRYKRYALDFGYSPVTNLWDEFAGVSNPVYVVQTSEKAVQRCILMTTDPGGIIFDPTCGSGTTAYVAEQWGRRWITCDTSRVAITVAKQRLMSALFDYYELAHPEEGVASGFKCQNAKHVTSSTIANNEPPATETLYDQPEVDKSKARVSGPFTVEAVPAPTVRSRSELSQKSTFGPDGGEATQIRLDGTAPAQQTRFEDPPDTSIARSGETLRQSEWRDVLLKGGVRGKGGQKIEFSRVEPLGGTRWLHADAETVAPPFRAAKPQNAGLKPGATPSVKPERVAISFGPEYAPLEQRQVELAWEEARQLSPRPAILLFVYSDIDPEAGKDIAELTPAKTGMTFLAAKIDADVWTKDLKKKARVSPSVWLVGQPDVELRRVPVEPPFRAADAGLKPGATGGDQYVVEVCGFDYFDTRTGTIESGDTSKIAMWLLDTDYDGRSLYPRQVFFPMADEDEGWARLARNLKAEIDPDLIQAYRGTVSLPFEPGQHKRIAVKIVDDRGIESLKIVEVK